MGVTMQSLVAAGPIPRRLAPSSKELLELLEALDGDMLAASGIFEPLGFEIDGCEPARAA